MNGQHIIVKAIIDTGNHLYEPLTGRPVCLVEYEKLKACIKPGVYKNRTWAIPYHTIGKKDGILWGVTADKMIFQNRWVKIVKSGCIIAVCHEKISKNGECSAIVHPDILEK